MRVQQLPPRQVGGNAPLIRQGIISPPKTSSGRVSNGSPVTNRKLDMDSMLLRMQKYSALRLDCFDPCRPSNGVVARHRARSRRTQGWGLYDKRRNQHVFQMTWYTLAPHDHGGGCWEGVFIRRAGLRLTAGVVEEIMVGRQRSATSAKE